MARLIGFSLSILIASALLLSAAKNGNAQNPAALPTARNSQNQEPVKVAATPHAVPSATASPSEPAQNPQCCQAVANSQGWGDWFWQNLATLLLVVVAVWAGRIAIRTLDRIADQARNGEIAANAAKTSADTAEKSLYDLERPWVFISLEGMEGWTRLWPAKSDAIKVRLRWSIPPPLRSRSPPRPPPPPPPSREAWLR